MQGEVLEHIPVTQIRPYWQNARNHPKRQLRQLAESIKRFRFIAPICIDENSVILSGHGRLEAAKMAGLKTAPCRRITHLNENQKKAYRIADNKIGLNSTWDNSLLANELLQIIDEDIEFDVGVMGFEPAEIDLVIKDAQPKQEHDTADEGLESLDGPIVSAPGDLWILGDHKIYCGDALDSVSYDALLAAERARAVFTDPPYNLTIAGQVSGKGAVRHKEFAMASGEMSRSQFERFLQLTCSHLVAYSIDGSIHFICIDWRHCYSLQIAAQAVYTELKNICVWNKTNGGMGSLYRSRHEFVLVFKNGAAPHINNVELGKNGRNRSNVWTYAGANSFGADRLNDLAAHPTVKPVAMIADALLDVTCRGDIILDPFGGYGSTLIAAEHTNRKARLIEIEPVYVDRTIRRWQRFAKDDAIHAETGEYFDAKALRLQSDPD